MKDYYNETVDAATFNAMLYKKQWTYTMPLRKRYAKFIPHQAFLVGENECLVLDGPKVIRFRKRWSLKTVERNIRMTYIINDEIEDPYFKIHLV